MKTDMVNGFLNTIANKFKNVKDDFMCNIMRLGFAFDYDVFSDTLVRCNEKLVRDDLCENDMLSYFWRAFKNNTLRELGYTRNKTTDQIPERIDEQSENNPCERLNEVKGIIVKKFGEELYRLFVLHTNGASYDELKDMTNNNKLKYSFRRIREFVRQRYN